MIPWTNPFREEDLQTFESLAENGGPQPGDEVSEYEAVEVVSVQQQALEAPAKSKSKTGVGLMLLLLMVSGVVSGTVLFTAKTGKNALEGELEPFHPPLEPHCVPEGKSAEEKQVKKQEASYEKEKPGEVAEVPESAQPPPVQHAAAKQPSMEENLEKAQEILLVAETVAEQLDSVEAQELLDSVQEQVREANSLGVEPRFANVVGDHLQASLKHLRRLHSLAVQRGKLLMDEEAEADDFPELWEPQAGIDLSPFEREKHDPTSPVHHMVIAFESIEKMSCGLLECFGNVSQALLNSRPFGDERDITLVTQTAEDLQYLSHNIKSQSALIYLATSIKHCISEYLKVKDSKKLEDLLLASEIEMMQLRVPVKLALIASKLKWHVPPEEANRIKSAKEKIAELDSAITVLREYAHEETNSWIDTSQIVSKAQDHAETVEALIGALKEQTKDILDGQESFSKGPVAKEAERIQLACILESEKVQNLLENARWKVERCFDGSHNLLVSRTHELNMEVYEQLISKIQQVKSEVEIEMTHFQISFRNSQYEDDPKAALDNLRFHAETLIKLATAKGKARLFLLQSTILGLFEEEIGLLQASSDYARLCEFRSLTATEQMTISGKEYDKAYKAVAEATTLVEVSKGLVNLCSAVTSMHRVIAEHRMGQELEALKRSP
ncbi:hypothetical protein, conserved [Eimeria tenella]|uniref:Uncharacterized protein n=1 Tax=Eimeria tenella TaxID=5802 RepID=U6L1X0_EIMTE|nr:hypothetical protein, conserved [Eimeria tenella]CDJ41765.1 hypothetical protein, conserved [Eimeria tenella]|eukprot:XP_013232515.1 hypothetical protein, conserved [Eimeria tenella]